MGLLVSIKRRVGTVRRCPKCGGTHVRLRSGFARQRWPFRCVTCKMTFGRLQQRECPFCGSRNARMRRDWHQRNNPLRCKECLSTWGGTEPKAGKKLAEVLAARQPERGEPCGACACCEVDERAKWDGHGTYYHCGRCSCCLAMGYDRKQMYQDKMKAMERNLRESK